MENKLWFKRKRYGWGWYPSSWQGWLVLLVWVALFSTTSILFEKYFINSNLIYFFIVAIFVSALIFICYKKGEKPGWRWGEDKSEIL